MGVYDRAFSVLLGEGKIRILVIFLSFISDFWELCLCGRVWMCMSVYVYVREHLLVF